MREDGTHNMMSAGDKHLGMISIVEINVSNAINSECTEAANHREMSARRGSHNNRRRHHHVVIIMKQ